MPSVRPSAQDHADRHDRRPVRALRLLRRQRRLDDGEALALAVVLEVLRDLRFLLLGAQLAVLRGRGVVVAREAAVFLSIVGEVTSCFS